MLFVCKSRDPVNVLSVSFSVTTFALNMCEPTEQAEISQTIDVEAAELIPNVGDRVSGFIAILCCCFKIRSCRREASIGGTVGYQVQA